MSDTRDAWGTPDSYYPQTDGEGDWYDCYADPWTPETKEPADVDPADVTKGLNPQQIEAMNHHEGPALVIAGAGSGKTRTVTARIVRLLRNGVEPREILCLTFTRKAASEMRERVLLATMSAAEKITISTFHSLSLGICREHPLLVDRDGYFNVWDNDMMLRELRRILRESWETFVQAVSATNARRGRVTSATEGDDGDTLTPPKAKNILSMISARKGLGPTTLLDEAWRDSLSSLHQIVPEIVEEYENTKRMSNALDFDDLVWCAVNLLKSNSEVREAYQERWVFVMVDEYQDTNDLQETFLQLLVGERKNIMVVGDEDQSIYGWRGANVEHILTFAKRYGGATVIKLGQNYRSTRNIVQAAARLIEENMHRTHKKLWSEQDEGWDVEYHEAKTPSDEADLIAGMIAGSIEAGYPIEEHAVLVRTRMQFIPLQSALTRYGVPYKTVGAMDLWDFADSRLILAWIRTVTNARDFASAGYCFGNWPRIGAATVETWLKNARGYDGPCVNTIPGLLSLPRCGRKTKKGQSIMSFKAAMDEIHQMVWRGDSPRSIVTWLYEITGVDAMIDNAIETGSFKARREAESRKERKLGFIDLCPADSNEDVNGFIAMNQFLDGITMKAAEDEGGTEYVSLSTIHAAKGLEWDHVFGAGCVEGLLPCCFDPADLDADKLEEERRLGYVLCTRARQRLVLTRFAIAPKGRGLIIASSGRVDLEHRSPSRFLIESMPRIASTTEPSEIDYDERRGTLVDEHGRSIF